MTWTGPSLHFPVAEEASNVPSIQILNSTLIDSTPGVLKAWATFAKDYNLDADTVAHATHGRRLCDTLKEYCNIQDEDKLHVRFQQFIHLFFFSIHREANAHTPSSTPRSLHPHQEEIKRFEQEVLDGGPIPLDGAIQLLTTLNTLAPPAPTRWTIVTSASNFYAPKVLAHASIPLPSVGIITSNDVFRGKPHPDPYLEGARACSVDPNTCEPPFVGSALTSDQPDIISFSSNCDTRVSSDDDFLK